MIDTDRLPKDVAVEYLDERIQKNKEILDLHREMDSFVKAFIKEKALVRDILAICNSDKYIKSELTREIMERVILRRQQEKEES